MSKEFFEKTQPKEVDAPSSNWGDSEEAYLNQFEKKKRTLKTKLNTQKTLSPGID